MSIISRNYHSILLSLFIGTTGAYAEESIKIDESKIVEMSKKDSTLLHSLKAEKYGANVSVSKFQEKFSPYLSTGVNSTYSNEPSFSSPAPESTSSLTYQLGYSQSLKHGMKITAGLYQSDSSFENFTLDEYKVSGLKMGLELDLWKNIFGRLEKKVEASSLADSYKAKELFSLKSGEHTQQVRSLYWSLVANHEMKRLRKMIIASTEKQQKDLERQRKLYVSDKSDVTRFSALKEQQKTALIMLDYQKEQIENSLKVIFPELRGKSIDIGNPNIDKASKVVMACIKDVASNRLPPLKSTSWVKVLKAAELSSNLKLASNKLYSSPDIKLSTNFDYTDHTAEVSNVDAYDEDPYRKNTVNLSINFPLNSAKSTSEKWQKYSLAEAKLAEQESYKSMIATTHEKTLRLINILNQVLKTQDQVNKLNKTNLVLAREKFNRAELPLVQLITDETTFLTGKISEVETKLLVVNTLLDYLKVFNNFECKFNQF